MAVLKGDGYGHGEKGIYPTLKKCGIERYAVAVWEEGASLRKAGCTEPILLLGDTCEPRRYSQWIPQKSSICSQSGAESYSPSTSK